jgi:hypothetical protein
MSKDIGLFSESYGPSISSAISLGLLFYFSDTVSAKFSSEDWTSSGLYSAIFGWAAIQTGFAFGVYGFVLGKTGGFIGKIRKTKAMVRFEGYIKRANLTGFILTFLSIPIIVTDPNLSTPMSIPYIFVSIWFSFFVWSFLAFLRLAYTFGRLASVRDKDFHGA